MITIEAVIARVTALRLESMETGVRSPNREQPSLFAYGEVCGRDSAFALVLEAMEELIEEEASREKREED